LIAKYLKLSKLWQASLLTFLSGLLVLVAYIWLISSGLWIQWRTYTGYYDQLATAFSHGQLALEAKPDPALMALPDPYDPTARAGVPYPVDISLYQGRFYLYFGPAPALVLLFVKVFVSAEIGDQYLVFLFVFGILLVQSLLILRIWRRYFQDIPPWIVPVCVLVSGLIQPFSWILREPRVYNAAITGGQFFFLAGFYCVFSALDRASISNWRLVLSGWLWMAAVGSRITLVLPVFLMTLLATLWIFRTYRRERRLAGSVSALAALGLPLVLGLASLGWYNWARFGSVWDTGYSYALAAQDLQKHRQDLFSMAYALPNLYNYLFIPPKLKNLFPFLSSAYGNKGLALPYLPLPEIYYSQEITGLLFSAPFSLFAIIPLIRLPDGSKRQPMGSMGAADPFLFKWLTAGLLGSFLCEFALLLVYFWAATRFFADFMPSLLLLSLMGFWQGYRAYAARPAGRAFYLLTGLGLIGASIIVSNLLALSISSAQFRQLNPVLWRALLNLFQR